MDNIEKRIYDTFVKEGDVVYDIGAHVGEISLYFTKLKVGIVYAFEPSMVNFPKLKHNIQSHEDIKAFAVALNDTEYECVTKFKDCANGTLDVLQPIKYVKLSNFIAKNEIKLPDFIKIDIEGMESIILNDFDFLFKQARPIIELEIHAAPRNSAQDYEDNPHWRWVDQGGYDFNNLKKHNYYMLTCNLEVVDHNVDYNPVPGTHSHVVLIPCEKMI